jgi:uncharacterized membrane protein
LEETILRGVTKALTYRLWQSLNTFIISLVITGQIAMAAAIVSLEVVVKLAVYFWHERLWNLITWGKKLP